MSKQFPKLHFEFLKKIKIFGTLKKLPFIYNYLRLVRSKQAVGDTIINVTVTCNINKKLYQASTTPINPPFALSFKNCLEKISDKAGAIIASPDNFLGVGRFKVGSANLIINDDLITGRLNLNGNPIDIELIGLSNTDVLVNLFVQNDKLSFHSTIQKTPGGCNLLNFSRIWHEHNILKLSTYGVLKHLGLPERINIDPRERYP